MSNFNGVSPVLLASSCDVADGNAANPDSSQLTYPYRKAIWIDEIRWLLRIQSATALQLGALMSTKLQFGRHYLMRDPVPLWSLGTSMGRTQEGATDTALATVFNYASYRWRLPVPLYLPPGEVLRSTFLRLGDGFGSMNVQVAYAGRTASVSQPVPSIVPIPYAASWATTIGNTYEQSNEKHLFNPFDVPLQVQRMTGRVLTFTSGVTASESNAFTPATAGAGVTLRMNDSWGGKMVNDYTGPSDIFDFARAAWTVDTLMPPKGVYEVQAWNIPATKRVYVAIVGTREEAL
jgi:hypothetical protein